MSRPLCSVFFVITLLYGFMRLSRFFSLRFIICILCVESICIQPCASQDKNTDSTVSKNLRQLRADLHALLNDTALTSAHVGMMIMPAKSKEILFAQNELKGFIPASNMKLYSTAMALEYLGKDFTYTTNVYLDGIIKADGEYIGNIIVRGVGDPTFSAYFHDRPMKIMETWAYVLDSLGIRSIRGNIIGDDSYFDQQLYGDGWQYDDFPYYYSAPVSTLMMNDNTIDAEIIPAQSIGTRPTIQLLPLQKYPGFTNSITTDTITSINYSREPYSPVIDFQGTITIARTDSMQKALTRTVTTTVDNPTIFFLQCFRSAIEARAIKVRGGVFGIKEWGEKVRYADTRLVCNYTSPPLSEIVRVINIYSHNVGAEALFKTVAKERQGTGSYEQGRIAMQEILQSCGAISSGTNIADGSGLSRSNLLTPKGMIGLLHYMSASPNKDIFINSLPQPGEPGTLRSRMRKTTAVGNVRAKTGTLSGVSSLSGYATTGDKEQFVFAMFFNNYTTPASIIRTIQDRICMRLSTFSRK